MTRRSSVRAQARRNYRERAPAAAPPPRQTRLTARVRKLYEGGAVPVREIAAAAGVTERTLYKYAQKGGWTPRYAWVDRGGVASRRRPGNGTFAPVKGAGGRFVSRADKGKPFARGLKATDPQGARRAGAACKQAEALWCAAQAEAEAAARAEERLRAIDAVNRALGELNAYRALRAKERRTRASDDQIERVYMLIAQRATDHWQALLAQERETGEQHVRAPDAAAKL